MRDTVDVEKIGCCGADCKTCKPFIDGYCKGCKLGYGEGERDIAKARCKIKVCCLKQNLKTCADCSLYPSCETLGSFYNKKGYKYKKYKQAIEFIRENGYDRFIRIADDWKNTNGK